MSDFGEGYPEPLSLDPKFVVGRITDALFRFYGGYGDVQVPDLKLKQSFPEWLGVELALYRSTQEESLDGFLNSLPGALQDRQLVETAAGIPKDIETHIKLNTLMSIIGEPVTSDPTEEVSPTALDTDLFRRVILDTLATQDYPPGKEVKRVKWTSSLAKEINYMPAGEVGAFSKRIR